MATRQEIEQYLKNPNVRKMLGVIASAEGVKHGYNTLFGNERLSDLSKHPGILKEFTQTDGKKNKTSAAGRYQFLEPTWNGLAKQLGLKDFSPKSQDIAAVALLAQNGALPYVLKGDIPTAVKKSGGTWASLPSAPDSYKQPKKTWSDIGMSGSTFDRAKGKREAQKQPTIADVYKAYRAGTLTAEQQKDFEEDVRAGIIMLPGGAKLKSQKKVQEPILLSQEISDAYTGGKLSKRQREDLEADMKDGLVKLPPAGLPDFDENGVIREDQPPQPKPQQAPLSTMDKIIGGGEAALTVGTGMIGGAIGQAAGGLHGIAESVVDGTFGTQQGAQNAVNRAGQFANALTYEPNTAAGQRAVGAVGEFIDDTGLDTLPPVLGGGLGTTAATLGRASVPVATTAAREVAQAAKPVVAQVVEQAKRPVAAVTEAAKSTVNKVGEATGLRTADAGGSMGAASVPIDVTRQELFNEFNVPSTTAQISRNPTDLAEMHNLARKGGEAGQIIQDHLNNQQQALGTAIDDMIYSKGATTTNAAEVGETINNVLGTQFKVERAAVNKKYQAVRESEGAQTKVDLGSGPKWVEDDIKLADERGIQLDSQSVLDLINENVDLETTAIYRDAKRAAVRLGIADDVDGRLTPKPKGQEPNVNQVEEWRKLINDLGSNSDDGDIRIKTRLKKLIDNSLDNTGSNAFREVRKEYSSFKQSWEGRAVLSDLVAMKRGANSGDRKIIDENIVNRIIKPTTSQKDLEFVKKKILQSEGGEQAWTDLQASIIDKIRNEAFSGAQDAQGSNALLASKMEKVVKTLDGTTQRLDTLLGKQEAEKIRNASELAKIIKTVPEGTGVNWLNTGTLIATMMDATIGTVFTGVPAPVPVTLALREAVKHMKGKKEVARAHAIIKQFEKPIENSGKFQYRAIIQPRSLPNPDL